MARKAEREWRERSAEADLRLIKKAERFRVQADAARTPPIANTPGRSALCRQSRGRRRAMEDQQGATVSLAINAVRRWTANWRIGRVAQGSRQAPAPSS
ncbi:MAG: hypothetical protein LBD58_05675, partial [Treponema sp.]|nr:hypothetical protein [Treponema sp.]